MNAISSDNSQNALNDSRARPHPCWSVHRDEGGGGRGGGAASVCVRARTVPGVPACVLLVEKEQDLCSAAVSEASQGWESSIKAGTKTEKEN